MAQKTVVTLIDDVDGDEADETVEFGLDGVHYEIDLTTARAESLRDALASFVGHARKRGGAGRSAPRGPRQTGSGRSQNGTSRPGPARTATSTAEREQNQAIREWARTHGIAISERGRIPATITEAFHRNDPSAVSDSSAPASGQAPKPAAASSASSAAPARDDSEEKVGLDGLTPSEREHVRNWAQQQGIEVKARGRLTKGLVANYRATIKRA